MADKDAKLRVEIEPMFAGTARGTLNNFSNQLRGQMRGLAGEARGLGQAFSQNFMKDAGKNAGGALGNLVGSAKGVAGSVLGIAGAYGMMDMAKRTLETEEAFRKLSSSIKLGTGQAISWTDIQKKASQVTNDWNHKTIDVSAAMQKLQDASGSYDFTAGQINNVAIAAQAAKEPLDGMAGLAGDLNEKFGIAGDGMQSALATVLSMANKGGLTFEDLSGSLSKIGASAKLAGLEGEKGLRRILGVANIAEGETGNLKQAVTGVGSLVEGLATGAFQKGGMKQGLDIEARLKKGASFEDLIADMIVKTKGDTKKLGDIVGEGPQLKVMNALAKVFTDAAKGPGGVKDGTAALKEALEQAGQSATSWSDVVAQATENMGSRQAKMDRAMNKLEDSFRSDAVASAIDKFADAVPKLSGLLGSGVEFAAANPGTAAGIAGGAYLGKEVAGGAAGAAGKALVDRYGVGALAAGAARFGGVAAMPFLMEGDQAGGPQTPEEYDALLQSFAQGKATPDQLKRIDEGFTDADGRFRRFDTTSQKMTNVRKLNARGGNLEMDVQMAGGKAAGMTDLEASLLGVSESPLLGGLQERALTHRKDLNRGASPQTGGGGGGMNAEQRALLDAMMRAGDKLDGTLSVKVVGTVTTYTPTVANGGDK